MGRGTILAKDRLVKRNWNGCPHCYFCNHYIQHIFLTYMLFASNSICHLVKIAYKFMPTQSIKAREQQQQSQHQIQIQQLLLQKHAQQHPQEQQQQQRWQQKQQQRSENTDFTTSAQNGTVAVCNILSIFVFMLGRL